MLSNPGAVESQEMEEGNWLSFSACGRPGGAFGTGAVAAAATGSPGFLALGGALTNGMACCLSRVRISPALIAVMGGLSAALTKFRACHILYDGVRHSPVAAPWASQAAYGQRSVRDARVGMHVLSRGASGSRGATRAGAAWAGS